MLGNESLPEDALLSERTLMPLRVTDLKQWAYCERIPYWTYVMPVEKKLPAKVEFGAGDHELLAHLEERRTTQAYGVAAAKRRFHVPVRSRVLGLTGVLDALLETEEERIPVEYKDTLGGVRSNHKVQLAAYGMMLEEQPGPPVRRGMLFVIPEQRAYSVRLDGRLACEVRGALEGIRQAIEEERIPPPVDRWAKCRDCEFLRFCGDRYPVASEGAAPAGMVSQII